MGYIKKNTKYKLNTKYKKRWELFKVWRKVSHVQLRAGRTQQMECLMKTCQGIQIHNKIHTMDRIQIIKNYCSMMSFCVLALFQRWILFFWYLKTFKLIFTGLIYAFFTPNSQLFWEMSVFFSRQMNCPFNEENSENKFQPKCESKSHHSNGHGKPIEGGEVPWFKFTTRVSQMWPLDASVAIFPYHIARCVKENITLSIVWKKILHYMLWKIFRQLLNVKPSFQVSFL